MKGNGRQMLEGAWDVVEQSLTDPLFWAERMLPGLFFLVLGGLLGSFLNVVAYRVPRGGSVSGRRSHCPACGTMIRGRDNVPVLGWLLLGGRCYACRGWISVLLSDRGGDHGGGRDAPGHPRARHQWSHLPGGSPGWPHGPDLVFVHASWRVMAAFAWHVLLLATLVVWSLFAIDGHRPRVRGFLAVGGLLGLVGLVLPGLIPVNVAGMGGWEDGLAVLAAVGEAAMAAGVGGALVPLLVRFRRFLSRRGMRPGCGGGAVGCSGWCSAGKPR